MNISKLVYCDNCKYCILEDTGYSNYTVEGTTVSCLLNHNPNFPKDYWYGEEPTLAFATKCPQFTPGEGPQIDVERTLGDIANYSDDPEIKQLLQKLEG